MQTPRSLLSRAVLGTALVGLPFASLALVSCDKLGLPTDPGSVMSAAANCPDVSSVGAIVKIDWAAEFGLDAAIAGSVGAGVRAAVELEGFAGTLDAKLIAACGGLAADLGKGGEFKTGGDACKAAMSAMGEIKAKIGASAKLSLAVEPPRCSASIDAMASCVAECDASVEPGSVTVECEPGKLSGSCEAECSGRCDMSAAAKCSGTCEGSCSANFSGSCGGECKGKCDGKSSSGGSCAGKCEGSCSALAEGSCGGQCEGSCQMSASAKCEGTCTGECSVEMKAPKCEGEIEPPKASAECNAACETQVQADVQCTPGKVALIIEGAADMQAAATYRAAIEKNLPAVLEIAVGMKDQALGVAGNVKAVVGGVQASIKTLKSAPEIGARLTACVGAPFKAAFDAAASVKANVNVSVEVQASVSASASAGGSASAG
ncbi:MAG: hypothetical protein K0V04_39775 [Deltaproteobacteria bacterium]|nr:hypothetical protein [Deltaproteobacteria bacterium]